MKLIKINCKNNEMVLFSYLARNCGAWVKGLTIYVPLEDAIRVFGSKEQFKSFCTHTATGMVEVKGQKVDEDMLTTAQKAEIVFGAKAESLSVVDRAILEKLPESTLVYQVTKDKDTYNVKKLL